MNAKNITGTLGVQKLSDVFDLVANSTAKAITDDLFRKGISISFGDDCDPGAVACQIYYPSFQPPSEPTVKPTIVFNPTYVNEDASLLAAVLVHEGTHFQQYLDGSSHHRLAGDLTVVDIEFRAFWNAAVYWGEIRTAQAPFTTVLEQDAEGLYQLAQQGEAALRNEIDSRYP